MSHSNTDSKLQYGIVFVLLIFSSLLLSYHDNLTYGLYVPAQPQDLLESSDMIFVGNITSVNVVETEESDNLDEYTVKVEEFLKNPQDLDVMTVRQSTALGGFEIRDRVLFYVKNVDGENTYFPESFIIPKYCDAKSVLEETRIQGGSSFKIMQKSIEKSDNFTANTPIEFVYEKDVGTLSGQSLDILIHIAKEGVDESLETAVFEKEFHIESKPCEWIVSAEWEITPKEGDYRMFVSVREGGSTDTSDTGFSVISDTVTNNIMSPLKQFESGIPSNETKCKEGLELILKSSDSSPACVKPETREKLIERGWAKPI